MVTQWELWADSGIFIYLDSSRGNWFWVKRRLTPLRGIVRVPGNIQVPGSLGHTQFRDVYSLASLPTR